MASNSVTLLKEIAEKLSKLQAVVHTLTPSTTPPCPPVTFTMYGLSSYVCADPRYAWSSAPFYTHPRGYSMVLAVFHSNCYERSDPSSGSYSTPTTYPDSKLGPVGFAIRDHQHRQNHTTQCSEDIEKGLYANFFLRKGDFDDYLRFPIRMTFDLQVMKKTSNKYRTVTVNIDDSTPSDHTARPPSEACPSDCGKGH